jgi:tRNA (guanine37-N1)-methyltransferase
MTARPSAVPRELGAGEVRGGFRAVVVTLLPEAFPGTLGLSLPGKALDAGLWRLDTVDLRRHGIGRHRNVDDTPAGGGAGMVLRPDVVAAAMAEALALAPSGAPRVCLSPRGRPFTQATARTWAEGPGVTLLCGRFEGIDQRAIDVLGLEEVSLGDFVMTGGEIAAQAMLDATLRLRPGVLGNAASVVEESFAAGLLEHPHYTRPPVWEGREVPPVLLSGHHAEVERWRRDQAERLTRERRPDLSGKAP